MLQIIQLHKRFRQGENEWVTALNKVNLTITRGSFVTVIGGNGSGKSTLLNCIAGSLISDGGTIILNNNNITTLPVYRRASFIARLFQDPVAGTAPALTILENFRLAALRRKKHGLSIGIDRQFESDISKRLMPVGLNLENKLHQPVNQLSGGQRQVLALLMAMYDPPELLLLDEPTAALDPRVARHIMKLANEEIRKHGITCLWVTHNMQDALRYGDRLIHMHRGNIEHDVTGDEKNALKPLALMEWFL